MTVPPSGEQFHLACGDQRATIVEVGGGVREYAVAGRPVLEPYPLGVMCDGAHGAPLIPWPNRLGEGRYRFDGADYQLALTEPDKYNAIHGLLRWRPWQAWQLAADRVVMGTRLHPMMGYPFSLDVEIDYVVSEAGLRCRTTATNIGTRTCPYGCGQHPYLSPGSGVIDDCTLQFAASTRIDSDPERQLPTGREPVQDTAYDFGRPTPIGALKIDFAFTDLIRDEDGLAGVRLQGVDGRTAEFWADSSYPFLEVFTGDTLAEDRRRRGLGCEPMTCPPNAFQTGESLVRLDPGESVVTTWGARLR